MKRIVLAVVLLALLFWAQVASAADPIRVEIGNVEEQPGRMAVTIGAIGSDGKALSGLNSTSFRATLDDQPLEVTSVQAATAARIPNSVVLLVDVSASMRGDPINQAKAAMQEFVRGLDSVDQIALYSFDTRVTLLQDFTADRALLNQAIGRLNATGDTAVYDAVIEATRKASLAPPGRRLVLLLSDGAATVGIDKRAASLTAAHDSGVAVFAVGEGSSIDRLYLTELAAATGGRFLESPTPAGLRGAYADVASALRNQYSLIITVPSGIDRTIGGTLKVQLTIRESGGTAERAIGPLPGAVAPPLALKLDGVSVGQKLKSQATLQPAPMPGIALSQVEYTLNGEPAQRVTSEPFAFTLDPAALTPGSHVLKAVATDALGRRGETQVSFIVPAPAVSHSLKIPWVPILFLLLLGAIGGLVWFVLKRRAMPIETVTSRIKPWEGRTEAVHTEDAIAPEEWPSEPPLPDLTPAVVPVDRTLGRLIVMSEEALRNGDPEAIREFELRSTPLTIGQSSQCDVPLVGADDIGAEEARVWVQKGRLVYHRLTTLSAMATEGGTSSWEFLSSGEELQLGPYRLLFELADPNEIDEAPAVPRAPSVASTQPQEHGMALREIWTHMPEDSSLGSSGS